MKELTSISKDEIRLCSGLDEYAFGKINFTSIVTAKGILASGKAAPNGEISFTFEPWTFTDVRSYEIEESSNEIVFYCGKNPLSEKARPLSQLYEEAGKAEADRSAKDKMFNTSFAVCSAITQAAKEGIELPLNGSGGIICDDESKLLFLPNEVFKYAIASLSGIEQANLHNCWINPSLSGLPALCFLRAAIAYKMLTGRFAYDAADSVSRNADILDKNFLPLELSVNGINEELAKCINKGLKLNSNSVTIPGKKTKGKRNEDLLPEADFPLQLLLEARNNTASVLNDKEFEEKAKSYKKMQGSRVNTKRTIRRNTRTIMVCIIALICAGLYIRSSYKNYLEDYTTKGLTSTQTIQAFFKGFNSMDVALIESFIDGKSANRYVNAISSVFVISKQRQANGGDGGFLKPAKFFLTATDYTKLKLAGMYGFTNLKIDGKAYDEYIELQKNKDKPEPLKSEDGITIEKGLKSVHSVEYYVLHTEGTNIDVFVTKNTGSFTLTFEKNKWIITDIELEEKPLDFDSDQFKIDYFTRVAENKGDVLKSIKELSASYDFLPSLKEMTIEKELLDAYLADPYYGIL